MRKRTYVLILGFVFCVLNLLQAQVETNRYALKLCTGIDPQGNTFDGAMCRDLKENGPCDMESICYNDEE